MFDYTPRHAAQALKVVQTLQAAGFSAYFAGGCVRDALLGRQPKDFDVATDAVPDEVRKIFGKRRTLAFGASFGVIGVLGEASTPTEVATFRSDGDYSDGRRPDSVRFGTAEHDALRRDFTINGMFYDPIGSQVIDYVGGEIDLRDGIIRAIGDPGKRIGEDKLRMLRAVRFTASLEFGIAPSTLFAIQQFAADVTVVSGERIGAEMRRMLGGKGATDAIQLLFDTNLIPFVWPSLAARAAEDCLLLPDVKRLASLVQPYSFIVLTACLLTRINTATKSSISEIVAGWKLSCDEQRAISESIAHYRTVLNANELPWSTVQPVVASRDAEAIIGSARAWAASFSRSNEGILYCEKRLKWPREQLDPPPLITGDTLHQLGFKPGPPFRGVLQSIRDDQLDQRIVTREEAIKRAISLLADL